MAALAKREEDDTAKVVDIEEEEDEDSDDGSSLFFNLYAMSQSLVNDGDEVSVIDRGMGPSVLRARA